MALSISLSYYQNRMTLVGISLQPCWFQIISSSLCPVTGIHPEKMKKRHCGRLSRDTFSIFAIFIALKRRKVMFSQLCVCSHGVGISGPMSFLGDISGTKSLYGRGGYLWYQVPSGDWVSRSGVGIRGEGWILIPQGWICRYVQEVGKHPSPLWTHGILWDMGNKWTVCILLECFLVINCITDCTQTRTVEIRKWFPCCIFFCKVLASLFIKPSRAYFSEEIVIFRVSARIPLWPNFL